MKKLQKTIEAIVFLFILIALLCFSIWSSAVSFWEPIDTNNDESIDVLDLISLKNQMLEGETDVTSDDLINTIRYITNEELLETDEPYFIISQQTAATGDKNVTVTVSLKNNPGILGTRFSIKYDESTLTLTKAEVGSAFEGLSYQKPKQLKSGSNFIWYGSKIETVQDGIVLTLTFDISESAEADTYPIDIFCSKDVTYDTSEAIVDMGTVSGFIVIN